jgi:simple sugar transport system substrate-binding protein
VDAGSGEGIAETSRKYNFPSKGIHTGGFDLLPVTLTAIKDGFFGFTIDQQPYLQGFYPLVQLFLYKLSGGLMFPCDTSTGLKFVTKSNVGLYLKGKSRFEGSTSKELLIK